jgi:nitrogen fixation protein FixH
MTRVFRFAILLLVVTISFAGCSAPSEQVATGGTTTGSGMQISFRSEAPPSSGTNTFEVTVMKDGKPVDNATVTTVFSMPAMPSMNMPEMHSDVTLTPAGGGRYRGTGELSMSGTWNVRVTVTQDGQELGTSSLSLVAK